MQLNQYHTYREICSQPEAWRATLADLRAQSDAVVALYQQGHFDSIMITGCGSPYYLALALAAQFRELGLPASAAPASEIWLNPMACLPAGRILLLAVSRSGETTELLKACERFRSEGRGEIVTLCAYPGRSLTRVGAVNILLSAAQEQSVAQTRAFSSLALASLALGAILARRGDLLLDLAQLADACADLIQRYASQVEALGNDLSIDRFYFLGSGPRYGLASELSLKMKEMTISHSEPFHLLEFRHGPKAMAGPGALIIGLLSATSAGYEQAVLADMRALGARTISIGPGDTDISLGTGLNEAAASLLALPFCQLAAFHRALAKGLNPDTPENLDVFVRL